MADKSWGLPAGPRTTDTPRLSRLDGRAAGRAAQAREREAARQERRDADARLAATDPHRAAERRKRGSGRKDIVREQRDTSGYMTHIDAARIRTLADRGTSVAGLAAAFGLSEEDVRRLLADA